MKALMNLLICCSFLFSVACSYLPATQTAHEVVPVKEPEVIELAVIDGKTTKQQIIDALGTPSSFSDNSLTYRYDMGADKILKLSVTQKDGTKFDVTIGPRKQDKARDVIFFMDYKNKNILDSTSV